MERIAIMVATSPTSAPARRAFNLAETLVSQGHQVTLGLLEDAVIAGVSGVPGLPEHPRVSVMVLADDLALRGFELDSLIPGYRSCGYGDLVDLMMEQADRTLGVF